MRNNTDISLHVDKTQSLADVVADDNDVRIQQPPVLGARSVVELEPVALGRDIDRKDVRLVNVAEERDRVDVFAGPYSPACRVSITDELMG
jgi:hypothetical protein